MINRFRATHMKVCISLANLYNFQLSNNSSSIHSASRLGRFLADDRSIVYKEAWLKWNPVEKFVKAKGMTMEDCKQLEHMNWREGYDEYLHNVELNVQLLNNKLA
jgi:hypothetical protein